MVDVKSGSLSADFRIRILPVRRQLARLREWKEYDGEVTECGGDHTVVFADPADAWIGILSRQYRIVKLALRLKWRHIIVIVIL